MKKFAIAAALSLALSVTAFAQQKVGPNGGMVDGKGGHDAELVVSPTELTVFLLDAGKPHATKGSKLKAVVQDGGKPVTLTLADVNNQKLVSKLAQPLNKGAIVVLTGKDDHGHNISARFVLD